jgi:hypothetical protein
MNFVTHLKMASMFESRFSSLPSFRKTSFMFGNVKPDIRFNALHEPHMKEYNYLKFVDMVESLPYLLNTPHAFSIRLGEVMHHLCDYFCLPHRDIKLYHQLKWHFDYENALEKMIDTLRTPTEALFDSIDIPHYDNFFDCIHEMVIYYDQFPHSIEKDIAFTFSVVNRVSQMLVVQLNDVSVLSHEHSPIY